MKHATELFFCGNAAEYRHREVTRNEVKKMERAAREALAEYRRMRNVWWANAKAYGLHDDDTESTNPYGLRVDWMSKVRWVAEAPVGAKYCNLSPAAQGRRST